MSKGKIIDTSSVIMKEKKYKCKTHGQHNVFIKFNNVGNQYNGNYCLFCFIDKLGIDKMQEVEE